MSNMIKKYVGFMFIIIFFWYTFSMSDVCVDDKCLGKMLYNWIWTWLVWNLDKAESITKKKVILNFCDNIYKFSKLPDNNKLSYNVKDSIFLDVLCELVWKWNWDLKFRIKDKKLKYYTDIVEASKKASWIEVGLFWKCGIQDGMMTNPDSMNNIDFACVTKDLFDNIESDISNIWIFVSYGGFASAEARKKWEKDFFAGNDTPCRDSVIYSDEVDNEYCQHPKTKKYVEEVSQSLKPMIKNLNLIDIEPDEIYELLSSNKNSKVSWAILMTIHNKMYEELYFYNIFLAYYTSVLKQYNIVLSLKKVSADIDNINNLDWNDEVLSARKNAEISKITVSKTLDSIKNIYRSYPIHIWFMMLLEEFWKLRNTFSKIYTPLEQLRLKLENAQDENKK